MTVKCIEDKIVFNENDINDKITMDLIRLKLGRYTMDGGLQLDYDAQDNTIRNHDNRKIIELFDDYFNKHKVIVYSHKGVIKCAIIDAKSAYYYNSILLHTCGKDLVCNEEKHIPYKLYSKIDKIIDYSWKSTTEIIFSLIKHCNS